MNAPSYRSAPRSRPSAGPPVRVGEDGFVPEVTLEGWVRSGEAERAGTLLVARDGRRYLLRDALRVVGRRNGEVDPYALTGRIESLRELIRQGAILGGDGMRIGPAVYDVEFGVTAMPLASADESGPSIALARP